ncbi:hypothetical protein GIB67_019279 [Kingdonia uniflora]|uniref:Uncharacterized protein n=1 Tax=Kingdonia uniflora TaxID=39325 RepID=A0A7J7N0F8_9MAGN|nr:hypothetical protein GIB67_019279 [Kingdonia uniflora]
MLQLHNRCRHETSMENENITGSNPNLAVAKLSFYDLFSGPEPHSDSRGKSSSTVVKGAQLGRTRSLVQRWEKRETLNNESPTTSRSIDTIPETSTLSHTLLTRIERAYGQHQQQTVHDNMGSRSENITMIFNMGAGYCDVCITATTRGVSLIKALSGHYHDRRRSGKWLVNITIVFAARVDVEDISNVILVGGCSNIPMVKSLVLELCKKDEAYMGMDPLEVVVCSAALEGTVTFGVSDPLGSLDLLTIQVTPQSLGIEADGHTFVPIIPRNMTMPTRKEMWFTTTRDNQTEALIVVYEGKGKKVDENRILGYFKIMGILSAPKGIPEICVCIDLDASNILRVFAGVVLPQTHQPVMPFLEVRMPTVDDGHGWCTEALVKMYGSDVWIGSGLVYFIEEDATVS